MSPDTKTRSRWRGRALALVLAIAAVLFAAAAVWAVGDQQTPKTAHLPDFPLPPTMTGITSIQSPGPRPAPKAALDCSSAASCRIVIERIAVDTTISPKPTVVTWDAYLRQRVASFGVPSDVDTTAWWSDGPLIGSQGLAVVLGHEVHNGYGVFNKLSTLSPGDQVIATDGTTVTHFAVISVQTGISKRDGTALQNLLTNPPTGATLALITCSGPFDHTTKTNPANTVVFAQQTQ